MTQVKLAKDALEQAITVYKCSKAVLTKTLETPTASERALSGRMKKLDESLNELNSRHTTWVSKSELDEDALKLETYSKEWLEGIWTEVYDL